MELTGLLRYDFVDPDETDEDDRTATSTAGVVRPLQEWLKVSVEGSAKTIEASVEDTTDYSVVGELMINF